MSYKKTAWGGILTHAGRKSDKNREEENMTHPYMGGPGLAVDPDAIVTANKPLYTITLFDGTVIGGKMAYQEQYALVVGGAYWIDGEEGQYPDGCELRIPYNAIKFWHMQP